MSIKDKFITALAQNPPTTNGLRIKNLRRFSDAAKWFSGGMSALLFAPYNSPYCDSVTCHIAKVGEFIVTALGIYFFVRSFIEYGKVADEMEENIDLYKDNTNIRHWELAYETWPWMPYKMFLLGLVTLLVSAPLVFLGNDFFCSCPKNKTAQTVNNNYYAAKVTADSLITCAPCRLLPINNVYFDFNKASLRPESYKELDKAVDTLRRNPRMQIEIDAHTDNIGSDDYNLQLSQQRADSVAAYMEKFISAMRLKTKGYGEGHPLTSNATYEGRVINRRVEFIIFKE